MTNGHKIDIDRLVEGLNSMDRDARDAHILPVLRETFPNVVWTVSSKGEVDANVHPGYRP